MTQTPLAIVILAAGKGTRMKSDLPKVMHPLAGRPLISLLIDQIQSLSPEKIIVVTAPDQEALRALVAPCETVVQEQQNGTGDAAAAALPALEDFHGNVLILLGDEPFVPLNILEAMTESQSPSVMAIMPDDPSGLGRMVTDEDGFLERIVEDKDCNEEEREIVICNAGNFCVPADSLRKWLPQIKTDNAQGEYYLTDLPIIASADNIRFEVLAVPVDHSWGINDRAQLAEHEKIMQDMLREKFLCEGVSMIDPETVYFHFDTDIAPGVTIEPSVFFGPGVKVEEGVHIKAFSHFEGTHIGKNTNVGPFARLRPGAEIGENVRIGNFVEIKKSTIGNDSKISHLSYVGDCTMGEDVNFGCGAITVNYDGFDKYQTTIENGVMIGSNSNLVAPVKIQSGAFIAAGSTISKNVEPDALSLTRPDTKTIAGWAKNFRAKKNRKTG